VIERLVKLLGQAAAASAAAAAAACEFHYGATGVREAPPWPWAIKVHQAGGLLRTSTQPTWTLLLLLRAYV